MLRVPLQGATHQSHVAPGLRARPTAVPLGHSLPEAPAKTPWELLGGYQARILLETLCTFGHPLKKAGEF